MLTICSFNIKNNYNTYHSDKALKIYNFLKDNDIDILCMQEVFSKVKNNLLDNFKDTDYKIYGSYRFKLKILEKINEATSIVTKLKVFKTSTYHLPFLPSTLKRVVTKVVIEDGNEKLVILNTHLDFMYEKVKKRQLKKIISIIKKERYPVILTGDFNIKINNPLFKKYIIELDNIGLKRVKLNGKTLKQSNYNRAIDHIFIPKNYKVIQKEIVDSLDISDHYPLLVKIKKDKIKSR